MGRQLHMWRQWGSRWISALQLHVGWEFWWTTWWVAHVRLSLTRLCPLAFASMHVGILAVQELMPHVPIIPILPRHGMHGVLLAP